MSHSFATLPKADRYILKNARIPEDLIEGSFTPKARLQDGLIAADIAIDQGKIIAIGPDLSNHHIDTLDLDQGMVLPCFVDMHTHLDKGHIWPRQANPTGDFMGALEAVQQDREAHWHASDVEARMEFALKCAYAHGTSLIRTHLDSLSPQHRISFEVFSTLRKRWAGRIDMQAAALFTLDELHDSAYFQELLTTITTYGGLLGGIGRPGPRLRQEFEILFKAAEKHGLDVDLHVDETLDPSVLTLETIADVVLALKFQGAVTVGHCCSLSVQSSDVEARVLDKLARAEINVVSLPMCNLYLQDRKPQRTPRARGVTILRELQAAGVQTALASDNTRDPFYAYGDLDCVEVLREGVRIAHLDHPLDDVASLVTKNPAKMLGRSDHGRLILDGSANLVAFRARSFSELFSRPQTDRLVLRHGKAISTQLPDYRELDLLFERTDHD